MNGPMFKFSLIPMIATLLLTACGPGPAKTSRVRAIGVNSTLGKALTSSRWCTSPSESESPSVPTFTKLDVRENADYIKTFYKIKSDNSLERVGEERGTWAVVADQFFTRAVRTAQVRQKVSVRKTLVPSERAAQAEITKQDSTETCMNLSDASGASQAYCTCVVN